MFNFLMDLEATINGVRPGGLQDPPIGGDLQRIIAPIFREWHDWGIIKPVDPINATIKD